MLPLFMTGMSKDLGSLMALLDGVTDSERSVGPEVGDDGEAGDAVAPVTVEAVEPVNSRHELVRANGNLHMEQDREISHIDHQNLTDSRLMS